jgi:hypothetical protein
MLHTTKQRKADSIRHTLHRNCLLKHVIKRKTEMTGRWGRRLKQLLGDYKNERIVDFIREALPCTLRRTCFGICCRPFVTDYGTHELDSGR